MRGLQNDMPNVQKGFVEEVTGNDNLGDLDVDGSLLISNPRL